MTSLAFAIVLLLMASTVGEGGAGATSLLIEHGIVLVSVLAIVVTDSRSERRLDRGVAFGLAGFFAAASAGALIAPYAFAAWLVLVEIASFSAVLWLASRTGPGLLPPLGAALAAWGMVQSIAAIAQRATGAALRPGAGFLNPNDLAAWLVAVVFLACGLLMTRGRAVRWAAGLAAIPAAIALVLIGSRGAVVEVCAGAVTAGLLARGRIAPATWRRGAAAAAVCLVLGAAGVAWRFRIGDPHGLARPSIWRASLPAFLSHPWTGTGPGQFATASANLNFARDDRPLRFEHAFSTPHSDLLRAPCEFGAVASLTLAATIVCGLILVARKRRLGALSLEETGALAALAVLAAHGLFNDATETPGLYLLFAAIAGAVVSVGADADAQAGAPLLRPARAAVVLLVLTVFAVGDVAPYVSWKIAARLPQGVPTDDGRARLTRAIRLNPFQPDLRLRAVSDLLARGGQIQLPDYVAARESAESAIRLNPRASMGYAALAHVEGTGCRDLFGDIATRARAQHAFEEAKRRAAHDPFLPIDAARFLLATGDPDGARREAEQALRIEPNAIPPRLVIAATLLAHGGPEVVEAAARLLDEADALAARYAAESKDGEYARLLLSPAAGEGERLRAAIAAKRSAGKLDAPIGRD